MIFTRLILAFILSACTFNSRAQQIEFLNFDSLNNRIHQKNDSLYIVNFWATWCKPCIEELPCFEKLNEEYKGRSVSLTLANLDFHSKVESAVTPFLQKKKILSRVVHITNTDPNEWINKIDESWSGAIPATVVIKNGKIVFFKEGQVSYEELKDIVDDNL